MYLGADSKMVRHEAIHGRIAVEDQDGIIRVRPKHQTARDVVRRHKSRSTPLTIRETDHDDTAAA